MSLSSNVGAYPISQHNFQYSNYSDELVCTLCKKIFHKNTLESIDMHSREFMICPEVQRAIREEEMRKMLSKYFVIWRKTE